MCESTAYIVQDGKEELLLENVEELNADENGIKLVNLFGDQKTVDGRIKSISFLENKIILEKNKK
jgi:predicted RNA-binding protein